MGGGVSHVLRDGSGHKEEDMGSTSDASQSQAHQALFSKARSELQSIGDVQKSSWGGFARIWTLFTSGVWDVNKQTVLRLESVADKLKSVNPGMVSDDIRHLTSEIYGAIDVVQLGGDFVDRHRQLKVTLPAIHDVAAGSGILPQQGSNASVAASASSSESPILAPRTEEEKGIDFALIQQKMTVLSQAVRPEEGKTLSMADRYIFVGKNSGAYCIQGQHEWRHHALKEDILSLGADGLVWENGSVLKVDSENFDQRADHAVATLCRIEAALLFGQNATKFPDHTQEVTQVTVEGKTYYLAKTVRDQQTVLFLQDKEAWEGKGAKGGLSLSYNLSTSSLWRNGSPQPLAAGHLAQLRKVLESKETQTIPTQGRHVGVSSLAFAEAAQSFLSREEEQQKEWMKQFGPSKPLDLPSLHYKGGAEMSARSIYFKECVGTTITLDRKNVEAVGSTLTTYTVILDPSTKPSFKREKFFEECGVWLGRKQERASTEDGGEKVTFSGAFHAEPSTIEVDEQGRILIPGEVYAKMINAAGDRWTSRFMSDIF